MTQDKSITTQITNKAKEGLSANGEFSPAHIVESARRLDKEDIDEIVLSGLESIGNRFFDFLGSFHDEDAPFVVFAIQTALDGYKGRLTEEEHNTIDALDKAFVLNVEELPPLLSQGDKRCSELGSPDNNQA